MLVLLPHAVIGVPTGSIPLPFAIQTLRCCCSCFLMINTLVPKSYSWLWSKVLPFGCPSCPKHLSACVRYTQRPRPPEAQWWSNIAPDSERTIKTFQAIHFWMERVFLYQLCSYLTTSPWRQCNSVRYIFRMVFGFCLGRGISKNPYIC